MRIRFVFVVNLIIFDDSQSRKCAGLKSLSFAQMFLFESSLNEPKLLD